MYYGKWRDSVISAPYGVLRSYPKKIGQGQINENITTAIKRIPLEVKKKKKIEEEEELQ